MAHVVKIRILFFVFSVMVLSGCAIGGAVEISEPTIIGALPADVKLDSSGIVRKGDLSLSIKPQNARVPILFIGLFSRYFQSDRAMKSGKTNLSRLSFNSK
jgi:hypothetical protein